MLNYIWAGMIALSIIVSLFNGRIESVMNEALSAAGGSITLVIGFTGVMCMWTGLMKIAEKSGLINILCRLFRPVMKLVFPDVPPDSGAMGKILLNITANMLGMGNAATPLGISAMRELDSINGGGSAASNAMCMFVVLNTASIQLIPSTIIAIRSGTGSLNPFEIILPVWIASITSVICAVIMTKFYEHSGERL